MPSIKALKMRNTSQTYFASSPTLKFVSPAQLSIVNVRFNDGKHTEQELNQINKQLSEMSTQRNNAIYYTTMLHNKTVLRFCCMHPLLTLQDVQQVVDQINEDLASLGLIES